MRGRGMLIFTILGWTLAVALAAFLVYRSGISVVVKTPQSPEASGRAELWEAIEYEIHKVLCNGKKPKEWTGQVLDGDAKDLAVAIVALVMAKFDATLAIAVPAAALVVRKGLAKLCRHKPNRPKRSAKAIMASMKRSWRKHGR